MRSTDDMWAGAGRQTTTMKAAAAECTFEEWERRQPEAFTGDVMWKMDALRRAMYALELARGDLRTIKRTWGLDLVAGQLMRAVGSIGANLTEAFSRPTLPDRARFFSYALGSVREGLWWYAACRDALDEDTYRNRIEELARQRRLLVGILKGVHRRMKAPAFRF